MVAGISLPPGVEGVTEVASVRVRYRDTASRRPGSWEGTVVARWVSDPDRATASLDPVFADHVLRVVASAALGDGTHAWADGDDGLAGEELGQAAAWLRGMGTRWGRPEAGELARKLEAQSNQFDGLSAVSRSGVEVEMAMALQALGYLE